MNKTMQVYFTAVLGALGGLLGWWIMGSIPTGAWNVWLAYPLVGAGLGLCIGGCVAATDGALIKRSPGRALRLCQSRVAAPFWATARSTRPSPS